MLPRVFIPYTHPMFLCLAHHRPGLSIEQALRTIRSDGQTLVVLHVRCSDDVHTIGDSDEGYRFSVTHAGRDVHWRRAAPATSVTTGGGGGGSAAASRSEEVVELESSWLDDGNRPPLESWPVHACRARKGWLWARSDRSALQ